MEYAEDLQAITASPTCDQVGPVGYCPFAVVFDPASVDQPAGNLNPPCPPAKFHNSFHR